MKMLIDGEFIDKNEHYDVINPYDGELIDTIPIADKGDVNKAINSARKAQKSLNSLSSKQVSENLFSACEELSSCADEIARLIVLEAGKPYKAAVAEVNRSIETLRFTSEEAKRIYGESIPLDATGSADERFMAFTQKIPLGVVAAITPFNFPVSSESGSSQDCSSYCSKECSCHEAFQGSSSCSFETCRDNQQSF